MTRIAIGGGPRTGKTTLAAKIGGLVYHTDSYMHIPWEDQPQKIIEDLRGKSDFVLEGIQVGRCLRKGLEVDEVIWLENPQENLTPRQLGMLLGCKTIFKKWLGECENPPRIRYE